PYLPRPPHPAAARSAAWYRPLRPDPTRRARAAPTVAMPRVLARPALLAALCGAFVLLGPAALAQANWGEISGRVTDAANGTSIPGATVLIEGTRYGTAANDDGRYRLRLPEGRYALVFSAVGFVAQRDSVTISRRAPVVLDVALEEATTELGDVVVEGEGVEGGGVGVSIISPETVENMPSPLNDPLDAVKVELGVTSNNETSNVYSVRGGGYNENLFFIDGFEI